MFARISCFQHRVAAFTAILLSEIYLYKFTCRICGSFPYATITATSIMIPAHSLTSGQDYIELTWKRPQYTPERYQLTYLSFTKRPCTHESHDFLNTRMLNLSSDTTTITITDLCPDSIYLMNFIAAYNPASIDSGITATAETLAENIRKCSCGIS